VLSQKVKQLKIESKALDELKGAMAKRERRVEEIKEYLVEMRSTNELEEQRKKEFISQLVNRNMEFKVFSGLEVLLKLEEALQDLDTHTVD